MTFSKNLIETSDTWYRGGAIYSGATLNFAGGNYIFTNNKIPAVSYENMYGAAIDCSRLIVSDSGRYTKLMFKDNSGGPTVAAWSIFDTSLACPKVGVRGCDNSYIWHSNYSISDSSTNVGGVIKFAKSLNMAGGYLYVSSTNVLMVYSAASKLPPMLSNNPYLIWGGGTDTKHGENSKMYIKWANLWFDKNLKVRDTSAVVSNKDGA